MTVNYGGKQILFTSGVNFDVESVSNQELSILGFAPFTASTLFLAPGGCDEAPCVIFLRLDIQKYLRNYMKLHFDLSRHPNVLENRWL